MEQRHLDFYSPEVGVSYLSTINVEKGVAYRRYQRDGRAISMLDSILSGDSDLFFRKQRKKVQRPFRGEFGSHALMYIKNILPTKGLRPTTVDKYYLFLNRFCEEMYAKGITPENITRQSLNTFISRVSEHQKYEESLAVKNLLKYMCEGGIIPEIVATALDGIRRYRIVPLVSYFEKDEIERMEKSFVRTSNVGKRNYAMFLLASRLGLRRSDVVNLKFDNIDWDRNEISLTQQKTGKPIVLPLTAEVGEALVDYIINARQKSKSSFVFLNGSKNDKPVTSETFTIAVSDCMRMAGIDTRDRHHGPHSLRHSLATQMMRSKVKMPVIKQVLGHTTEESTYNYLRIDHDSLMKCSMDVPEVRKSFYLQKGGCL
jgi:integrase